MIDVTIPATLGRAKLLDRTMESFAEHVTAKGLMRALVNVDVAPTGIQCPSCQLGYIRKIMIRYFPGSHRIHLSRKPSFARAVRWLWGQTEAEWVFHLEEDWVFLQAVDLNAVVGWLETMDADYARLPKEHAPVLDRLALQPSVWSGAHCRDFARVMVDTKDPEKQLRLSPHNEPMNKLLRVVQYVDYPGGPYVRDIGREYNAKHGLAKWNKNLGGETTWTVTR